MDWDKLRVFHAAAEAGSFTHAGETLNLSQSAVSRQVSNLEDDLKISLFHRHARGLLLTEQGELLYRTAHEIFAKLEAVQTRLTDSKEKPSGELKITTTPGLGSGWLVPRIGEFVDLYPDIQVQIILSDVELDLSMRQADIALRMRRPTQPDLIQRKLFTVHFHAYASPDYLRRKGHPASVDDLVNHRILVYGEPVPNYLNDINWLAVAGMPKGERRTPTLTVNNLYSLRKSTEQGMGIAILPDYIIPDSPQLVQLLPDSIKPEFDTYFVYPEELRHSARVSAFRDFILTKVRYWKY